MIKDGYSLPQIADYIQKEAREYVDVTRASLVKVLEIYKRDGVPAEEIAKREPKRYLELARQVSDSVNVLKELEGMFRIQKARIERFVEEEEDSGTMKPNISREFDAVRGLLDRIHQVRMDTGLDERHLGTLKLQAEAVMVAEERYGTATAEVLKDPERRRKILAIFEQAMKVKALPVVDGEHREVQAG